MRNKILAASVAALVAPAAFGGTITTATDLKLGGGMTAGYFYTNNTGSSNEDNYHRGDWPHGYHHRHGWWGEQQHRLCQ